MIHLFSLAFLMLATTSCGHWANLQADKYEDKKDPEKHELFSEKRFLDAERPGYKHSSGQPQFCLALSGGGIRSAAYSIGVLKGLHESGKLRDVEIISAVSGGSYAATWFYDQYPVQVGLGAGLGEVLSRNRINEVAKNVGLLNVKLMSAGLVIQGQSTDMALPTTAWDVISGLVIYTGGALWAWVPPSDEDHETKAGHFYEDALGNAFHSGSNSGKRPSFQTASHALPYLIVNATVRGIDDSNHALANGIFEFTSHGMGSPSVGYTSWDKLKPENRADTYSFSRIASISGAVVDKRQTKWLNLFGRDIGLGYAMLDPTYPKSDKGFFVLTDGGHFENLGAYGLIKRNCKEILVVDAEYDGKAENVMAFLKWLMSFVVKGANEGYEDSYQFEGFGKLKTKLEREGMALQIKELDQATTHWEKKENREPTSNGQTSQSTNPWSCWAKEVKTSRKQFDCSNPIREGEIRSCKDNGCEPIGVTYVKLSADRGLLDDCSETKKAEAQKVYGPLITIFYNKENESEKKCKKDEESKRAKTDENFPHYSTMLKPVWADDQFLAIAELGCRAVRRHYDPQFRQSADVCIGENK